jgi:3-oxoacyl-[acyl-carrier protein] reductase
MKTSTKTHEGRVALVTGAAQGIGQAIAVALAARGAQVIATDLNRPDDTVAKIGPTAHAFQLDVAQEENWRSVSVKSRDVGDVDIVVNNAGYFPNRSIDELDLPTWRKTMATNLDAQFLSAKYFLPAMRRNKWGRFVGISSNMVGLAIPGMSHYIATKMGIIGFMRGLANDVASDGITANAVLPGLTNTLATAPQSEEQKRATWEQQAIKRLGEPEDVTGAILFLTSDDAAFLRQSGEISNWRNSKQMATRVRVPVGLSAKLALEAISVDFQEPNSRFQSGSRYAQFDRRPVWSEHRSSTLS